MRPTRWILSAAALACSCSALAQGHATVAAYAPSVGLSDSELFQAERSGRKAPQTAALLLMLGDRYQAHSRYVEAGRVFQRSLVMFEETMGAWHPNVGAAAHKLAQLYYAQGAYASAVPYYRRAISVYERSLGTDHAIVAELRIELEGCNERVHDTGTATAPPVRNLTSHYGPVVLRQRAR